MKNIHIENSYNIWLTKKMKRRIRRKSNELCGLYDAEVYLNRSYLSMYIEWWLHNIGYYITKPLADISKIKELNERFKHVDLEEWN